MNYKSTAKCVYAMLLGTTAIGLSVPALAQSATQGGTQQVAQNDQGVQEMEQIIVTATRREERLQDVPISITVFNQQQLSNHNVINAEDLAAYTPSLGVNNDFGSQNTSFSIRGFSQDIGTQPTVGVYFADVVAPRGPAQGTAAGDGAGPGDFFDLQNVQVLKGPQGTLFGLNTTGGDVLLVPQKPTDEFGGYVEGSTGNFGMWDTQGVINIPVNDHIRLRFGVDHMTRNGYLTNTSGIGPGHFDDVDYTAVRASADIDVTSNLENYTIATYTYSGTNGDVGKLTMCTPVPISAGSLSPFCQAQLTPGTQSYQGSGFYDVAQNLFTNPYSKLETWRVINTTTWQVSDNLTIKNIASYSQIDDKLNIPLFGTNYYTQSQSSFGEPGEGSGNPPGGIPFAWTEIEPIPGGSSADEATYSEELQFQGTGLDNRLTWQAGLYYDASDPIGVAGALTSVNIDCPVEGSLNCLNVLGAYGPYANFGGYPAANYGGGDFTATQASFRDEAAYAQATYKFNDQFRLTEGVRYTQDAEYNTTQQIIYTYAVPSTWTGTPQAPNGSFCANYDAVAPGCTISAVAHSHAPTYMIDLDYTPDADTLVYAKYSRGYRAGGINADIPAPFNAFGPERVNTYEGGVKTSFEAWGVSGVFDAAAFFNDFDNQILFVGFVPNPSVCPQCAPSEGETNAGKSQIWGIEAGPTIIPFEGMTLHADYTYLNDKILKVTEPAFPAHYPFLPEGEPAAGLPTPLTPQDKVAVTATYVLPLDETIGKISVGATYTHTDVMLTNYIDTNFKGAPFGLAPLANQAYLGATGSAQPERRLEIGYGQAVRPFVLCDQCDRRKILYLHGGCRSGRHWWRGFTARRPDHVRRAAAL